MEPGKEVAVFPPADQAVVSFNPGAELQRGHQAAAALMEVIASKPRKVVINGEQYLEFEDWQTLARFFNITVGTEKTEPFLGEKGVVTGFLATAVVYDKEGKIISRAEASCTRTEAKWKTREEFQLRSMAQTRACAKAFRNVLAWVVVLAGFKATPAEELDDVTTVVVQPARPSPAPAKARPVEATVVPAKPAARVPGEDEERISRTQLNTLIPLLQSKAGLAMPADEHKVLAMVKSKYSVEVKTIEEIPVKIATEMIKNLIGV